MDFFSVQQFFTNMFPGKSIAYEFDKTCIRQVEISMTDGLPTVLHFVEFQKVKVSVEGMAVQYLPISAHRASLSWVAIATLVSQVADVYVADSFLAPFLQGATAPQQAQAMTDLEAMTGLTEEEIDVKVQTAQSAGEDSNQSGTAPPIIL